MKLYVMSSPCGEVHRPTVGFVDEEWQYIVPISPSVSALRADMLYRKVEVPQNPASIYIIFMNATVMKSFS